MREALLPAIDTPNTIGTWMKFFQRWQYEVDRLSIDINNDRHGPGLKRLVENSKGNVLMFIESDGIIFSQGVVNKMFSMVESGEFDIVGSPRMSCSPCIAEIAKKKFNLDYSGEGDKGPNFWPNFFFVRKELLMSTDLNFDQKGWKKGELLLGEEVPEDCAGDTMVWMSLQLRGLTTKILEIPQYHSSPYDLTDYEQHRNLWDRHCPWIHLGSISGDFSDPHSEIEVQEIARRIMWRKYCGENMDTYIEKYHIDPALIEKYQHMYEEVLR